MSGATRPGLLDPLLLGRLWLDRRLFMAPMAGISSRPFRRSVRRWGAGLTHTEMVAAAGVWHGNRRTLDYLVTGADEHPVGVQLFGTEAPMMVRAAEAALHAGADLVDLNFACPVRKVVKTGAGAAQLADPAAAAALVRAVVSAVAGAAPVTVKIRAGLRAGDRLGLSAAPRLVEAGAAAVCLHPRYASQLYRGAADHALTEDLCRALPVPVFASGDVSTREDCERLMAAGAAAVMVARAAVGRPWVFAELLVCHRPSRASRRAELRRFAAEAVAEYGERGVGYLRQFWPGFRRSGAIDREEAAAFMAARTGGEVLAALDALAP